MAYLLRLIFAVLVCGAALPASAQDFYWVGKAGTSFPDALSACQNLNKEAAYFVYLSSDYSYAECHRADGYYTGNVARSGNGCTSPAVFDQASGSCKSPPPTCTHDAGNQGGFGGTPYNAGNICFDSCTWTSNTNVCSNGVCGGIYVSTGTACSSNTPGITSEPGSCPKGTHNISTDPTQLNCTSDSPEPPTCWEGSHNISTDPTIAICVADPKPPSDPPPAKPADGTSTSTTTVTNADGSTSTTTTTTTTTTNADGTTTSTNESKVTKCDAAGTCTTETTTGGGGASDYCKLHPELTSCTSSEVSGDCAQGKAVVSCEGDAIQCAMYKKQMDTYCEAKAENDLSKLGNRVMLGGTDDPLADKLPSIANATQVALPGVESQGFLGGGSGLQDKTFSVGGHSFVIPLSNLNQYLIVLRGVVMLAALLFSFRLLAGVILKD